MMIAAIGAIGPVPAKHRKEVKRLAQQNNLLPSIWARRALMEPEPWSCATKIPRHRWLRKGGWIVQRRLLCLSSKELIRPHLCDICFALVTPMRIHLAEVADRQEIIQFACDRCDAQLVRNLNSSPARVIWNTMK
jgi:hypothetical protein